MWKGEESSWSVDSCRNSNRGLKLVWGIHSSPLGWFLLKLSVWPSLRQLPGHITKGTNSMLRFRWPWLRPRPFIGRSLYPQFSSCGKQLEVQWDKVHFRIFKSLGWPRFSFQSSNSNLDWSQIMEYFACNTWRKWSSAVEFLICIEH